MANLDLLGLRVVFLKLFSRVVLTTQINISMITPIDNPVIYKIYIALLGIAALNYIFLAFKQNPLDKLLSSGVLRRAVYLLMGLAGAYFIYEQFEVQQYIPSVQDYVSQAVEQSKQAATTVVDSAKEVQQQVQKEIQTLEHFRRAGGCSAV